jgi:hypothetical protein
MPGAGESGLMHTASDSALLIAGRRVPLAMPVFVLNYLTLRRRERLEPVCAASTSWSRCLGLQLPGFRNGSTGEASGTRPESACTFTSHSAPIRDFYVGEPDAGESGLLPAPHPGSGSALREAGRFLRSIKCCDLW